MQRLILASFVVKAQGRMRPVDDDVIGARRDDLAGVTFRILQQPGIEVIGNEHHDVHGLVRRSANCGRHANEQEQREASGDEVESWQGNGGKGMCFHESSWFILLPLLLCHFTNAGGPCVSAKLLVEVFQLLFQLRDDFRVFGKQVVLLTDVGAEIVKSSGGL